LSPSGEIELLSAEGARLMKSVAQKFATAGKTCATCAGFCRNFCLILFVFGKIYTGKKTINFKDLSLKNSGHVSGNFPGNVILSSLCALFKATLTRLY